MVPLLKLTRFTGPAQEVLALAERYAVADSRFAISTGDLLLALASVSNGVAASAHSSIGVTADVVRQELAQITRSDEDGASSYGISRKITFTRMGLGILSHTIMTVVDTGHAENDQPRMPTGPYLCTGGMLLTIIRVLPDAQPGPSSASDASQVLHRLGVDRSAVFEPIAELVRRSPADERKPGA